MIEIHDVTKRYGSTVAVDRLGFEVRVQTPSELRRVLTSDGTLVQISGDSDNRWFGPVGRIIAGRLLSGRVSQTVTTFTVQPNHEDLQLLASLLADGSIRPVIDSSYPLDQVDDAINHVEEGHTRGKVAVHVHTTIGTEPAQLDLGPGHRRTWPMDRSLRFGAL